MYIKYRFKLIKILIYSVNTYITITLIIPRWNILVLFYRISLDNTIKIIIIIIKWFL